MVCYIILHYMVLEETMNCIDSIKSKLSYDNTNKVKIIIVDNKSPNGTGIDLKKMYKDDELVDVLINNENSGFARGNNLGYKYAKEKYNPDFLIVMNNDVEIISENFETRLSEVYKNELFHILGPDIFSTTYSIHQNPKRLHSYTRDEVVSLNEKFKKNLTPNIKLRIKCFLKSNKVLRNLVYKNRNNKNKIDYTKKYSSVPLHGSCLIVSRLFMEKEDVLFNPNTFFYYEMEILDYYCNQKGYKTIYDPELKVLHHQNVSTNVVYNNMLKKTIFSNKCNFESTKVFIDLIDEMEANGGN